MPRPPTEQGFRGRKACAEFVGAAFLVGAVVGSAIASQRLSPGDVGLELIENTLATAAALAAIILAVGPVPGAHLNPVITLFGRFIDGVSTKDGFIDIAAQFAGGVTGAIAGNTMSAKAVVSPSTQHRSRGPHAFAAAAATLGLVLVVSGRARSGRSPDAPFAVGAYIATAYWFTSSTSFAHPAIALAAGSRTPSPASRRAQSPRSWVAR